jgi:RNA polymerase sigma-70 factor (ECF subfamily)
MMNMSESALCVLEKRMGNFRDLEDRGIARHTPFGKKDFVRELVIQHSDRLFRIILRLVQSRDTAEDILQDTWVNAIRKLHQYDPSRPISAWLTKIAVNRCRDYWRRERLRGFRKQPWNSKRLEKSADAVTVDSSREVEKHIDISAALMTLSHKLREVVVLKFYSGLTLEEIAQVLDVPSGTVKSRLYFALTKLREHLLYGETI